MKNVLVVVLGVENFQGLLNHVFYVCVVILFLLFMVTNATSSNLIGSIYGMVHEWGGLFAKKECAKLVPKWLKICPLTIFQTHFSTNRIFLNEDLWIFQTKYK